MSSERDLTSWISRRFAACCLLLAACCLLLAACCLLLVPAALLPAALLLDVCRDIVAAAACIEVQLFMYAKVHVLLKRAHKHLCACLRVFVR